eukprot:gene12292-biopygen1354
MSQPVDERAVSGVRGKREHNALRADTGLPFGERWTVVAEKGPGKHPDGGQLNKGATEERSIPGRGNRGFPWRVAEGRSIHGNVGDRCSTAGVGHGRPGPKGHWLQGWSRVPDTPRAGGAPAQPRQRRCKGLERVASPRKKGSARKPWKA